MQARSQNPITKSSQDDSPGSDSSTHGGGILSPDEAFNLDVAIKTMRGKINEAMWTFISTLRHARRNRIWQALGHESWAHYLGQPEVDLAVQTVDNYITVLNRLDEHDILPPAGVSVTKLAVVAPHLTKKNYKRLIDMAKTLSRSDLRAELTDQNPMDTRMITCPHCKESFPCP